MTELLLIRDIFVTAQTALYHCTIASYHCTFCVSCTLFYALVESCSLYVSTRLDVAHVIVGETCVWYYWISAFLTSKLPRFDRLVVCLSRLLIDHTYTAVMTYCSFTLLLGRCLLSVPCVLTGSRPPAVYAACTFFLQPWSLSTIMLLWHSFLIIIIIIKTLTLSILDKRSLIAALMG